MEEFSQSKMTSMKKPEDAFAKLNKALRKSKKLNMEVHMCICEKRDLVHNDLTLWNRCKNCDGWISDEMLADGF